MTGRLGRSERAGGEARSEDADEERAELLTSSAAEAAEEDELDEEP